MLPGRKFEIILGLCGLGVPFSHPVIALFLELLDQLRTAVFNDLAAEENVHELGLDISQNPLVVRDHQYAGGMLGRNPVDPFRDDPHGVDVQTAIGLVENREGGSEHGELKNLGAFFFPPEKPSLR